MKRGVPEGIGLYVTGGQGSVLMMLEVVVNGLLRLGRLLRVRDTLRIAQLQFRKGIELLGQTTRVGGIRVRGAKQIREAAASERALKLKNHIKLINKSINKQINK